jgi:hypothetical protein
MIERGVIEKVDAARSEFALKGGHPAGALAHAGPGTPPP